MTQLFASLDAYVESKNLIAELWVTPSGYALLAYPPGRPPNDEEEQNALTLAANAAVEGVLAELGERNHLPPDWPTWFCSLFPAQSFEPWDVEKMGLGPLDVDISGKAIAIIPTTPVRCLLLQLFFTRHRDRLPKSAFKTIRAAGFDDLEHIQRKYEDDFPEDPLTDQRWKEVRDLLPIP